MKSKTDDGSRASGAARQCRVGIGKEYPIKAPSVLVLIFLAIKKIERGVIHEKV
ncbi:hypothetical protein [Synergistes jonesii]|uniref:hypothetical protein n=1 Tax=Synergistes jonesii TaxID=2754 RepID=UPI001363682D|nr:hypothetical protein [Synergistes jonesii]